MDNFKAGTYKATKDGFIFGRLIKTGSNVDISSAYLLEHKEKTGKAFSASWLVLISPSEPKAVDPQIERETEEAALRAELESLGVEVDGRWGAEKLKKELAIAHERQAI